MALTALILVSLIANTAQFMLFRLWRGRFLHSLDLVASALENLRAAEKNTAMRLNYALGQPEQDDLSAERVLH